MCPSVRLSACLSVYSVAVCVCVQNISERYERILTKFFGKVEQRPRINRLDFGGDADHDPDPEFQEFLKNSFIYYRDSCRQPVIKHDNPWRRHALYRVLFLSLSSALSIALSAMAKSANAQNYTCLLPVPIFAISISQHTCWSSFCFSDVCLLLLGRSMEPKVLLLLPLRELRLHRRRHLLPERGSDACTTSSRLEGLTWAAYPTSHMFPRSAISFQVHTCIRELMTRNTV